MSSLNNDLFRNHVRDNPLCDLCGVIVDATHYFFHCIKYFDESKGAKIRNRYNQVPHLTQDTNGKVTNSQYEFFNPKP